MVLLFAPLAALRSPPALGARSVQLAPAASTQRAAAASRDQPGGLSALRPLAGGVVAALLLHQPRPAGLRRVGSGGRAAAAVAARAAAVGKEAPAGAAALLEGENHQEPQGQPRPATVRPVSGPAVVVTGGSEGVGRAAALAFARLGYNVVIAARSEEPLNAAEEAIKVALKPGRQAMSVSCDITSEADVASLHAASMARFPDICAVICGAGVCMTGDFLDHSMQDYEAQMRVNFLGHVATAQAFLPDLVRLGRRRGGAHKPALCFVNSFGGRMPLPNMSAYCASKYALQGFADTVRMEVERKGVHVATVHPGVVRTSFRDRAQWRGATGESARGNMNQMLDGGSPLSAGTQSAEEVADSVVQAVRSAKKEVVVGSLYQGMLGATSIAKGLGIA